MSGNQRLQLSLKGAIVERKWVKLGNRKRGGGWVSVQGIYLFGTFDSNKCSKSICAHAVNFQISTALYLKTRIVVE